MNTQFQEEQREREEEEEMESEQSRQYYSKEFKSILIFFSLKIPNDSHSLISRCRMRWVRDFMGISE